MSMRNDLTPLSGIRVLDFTTLPPGAACTAEPADSITQKFAAIFLTRPAAEWVERLAPVGAAVTVVNHGAQLLDDPQIRSRGTVVESDSSPVPANPVRLHAPDGSRTGTATSAPHRVGEDTADVLAAVGFTPLEIAELLSDGLI